MGCTPAKLPCHACGSGSPQTDATAVIPRQRANDQFTVISREFHSNLGMIFSTFSWHAFWSCIISAMQDAIRMQYLPFSLYPGSQRHCVRQNSLHLLGTSSYERHAECPQGCLCMHFPLRFPNKNEKQFPSEHVGKFTCGYRYRLMGFFQMPCVSSLVLSPCFPWLHLVGHVTPRGNSDGGGGAGTT